MDRVEAPVLTHVALACADVDRTIAFYRRYAGLVVVHDRSDDGTRVAWVGRDPVHPSFVLVLIEGGTGAGGEGPAAPPPTIDHLGFACASRADVDSLAARARAEGVPVVVGPEDWGPPVGYIAILLDPDGNRVELSHGQPIRPPGEHPGGGAAGGGAAGGPD